MFYPMTPGAVGRAHLQLDMLHMPIKLDMLRILWMKITPREVSEFSRGPFCQT